MKHLLSFAPAWFVWLWLMSAPAAFGQVGPILECVAVDNAAGAATAYYGYNNQTGATVTLAAGFGSNQFAPTPANRNQPSGFAPGRQRFAFSVTFPAGSDLTWLLAGSSITANAGSPRCVTQTFTYQGRLQDTQTPTGTGAFQMQFRVFDAPAAGQQIGATMENANVSVTNGIFTTPLNLTGAVTFTGADRFLEISVRRNAGETYTTLAPRQTITAAPYALHSQSAATAEFATTAALLGSRSVGEFVLTNDARLADARPPTAGSSNYLQNTATQQTANFNISGNGTVGGNLTVSGTINGTVTNATNAINATNATNAINATNATNAAQLGGVAASQYVQTNDARLTDARPPAAGSGNYLQNTTAQQAANFNISGNGAIGGNASITGTVTSGCRAGFTAFAGGRLCVSAMQPAATFYGGAVQTCVNMQARVGNSADVMLTISSPGFNYFAGATQGWLADHFADNVWGTWFTQLITLDFDGPPLNVYTGGSGGTAPSLPYRCVY